MVQIVYSNSLWCDSKKKKKVYGANCNLGYSLG